MTDNLAADVVSDLVRGHYSIAAAESLTSGLFCSTLASVPGASAALRGGAVVYATDLKATLAGVSRETLRLRGPVAEDTAAELAEGIRLKCSTDIGIGLTGVAGPSSQNGCPVGTVFLGFSARGVPTLVLERHFSGTRNEIRQLTVETALVILKERWIPLLEHNRDRQ